jgi:hypothetical protein
MSLATNTRLNLVVDQKMEQILFYFRSKYPLLKDADLIKMAVSGFYTNELANLPMQTFNQQEDESLSLSLKSKTKTQPVFSQVSDLVNYLEN